MTTLRHITTLLCVIFVAVCVRGITARAIDPYGWDSAGSSLLSADVGVGLSLGADLSSTFFDNIYMQLMKNNAFRLLFSTQVSADLINSIGSRIGQAFAREFQLDAYTTTNAFVNAMAYVYAGSSAEAYANAIASASFQVLMNYNILNSYNAFSLANTAANIISRSMSGAGVDFSMDDMYDVFDDDDYTSNVGSRINSNIGAGFGTAAGLGAGLGLNAGLGAGLGLNAGLGAGVNGAVGAGLNAGLGLGANVNADVGVGARAGLGVGLGAGLNAGLGLGAGVNSGLGVGINSGLTLGAGVTSGLALGALLNGKAGLGVGVKAGLGLGADVNAGLGIGADVNAGLGIGADVNAGLGLAAGLNAGLGVDAGLNVGADVNVGAGLGVGVKVGTGAGGANANISLPEAIASFKQRLGPELLKDKVFKTVFSDSIPAAAVSSLSSAIAQFLSKAFSLPRSYLVALENDIALLVKNELTSPEAYADGISTSFINLLAAANLLVPSAIGVQVGMASKAITSGLLNYLGTSKVAGVGLGIGSNPYNSYFSVLSGLEMLPYVGPDAVSRKYPPILKAAKASNFGAKFSKALSSNLISSTKFSDAFLLGIPAKAWKKIAKSLGKNMAEAFGSPNPTFFSDIYANALLSVGEKLSYKTYARVLAAATSKALYALGYFVSGNPNIQAAIASNAIVKGIKSRSKSNKEFPPVSSNLGLPWMTPLAGVAPPPLPTKAGSDNNGGLKVGAGLGLDVGLGADIGIGADLGLDVNADVQANLDAGIGILGGAGLRRRKRDLFDANAALGVAADVNANVGAALDAGVNVAAGLDVGAAADIGANVGLGADVGLGLGLGANLGLGGRGGNSGKNSRGQARSDVAVLSILDVLPPMLSEKLFTSTAMYTAMSLVGPRKVANLISQGMAAQFGFQSAAAFANTYDISLTNLPDNSFGPCVTAIARATTDALGTAGILTTGFTVQSADQLSTAIVAKFSSLIATSLDTKDWNVGAKWTYIYDQDFIDPPLSRGYSYLRPNVFSNFVKSYDDSMNLDYGLGNSVSLNLQPSRGLSTARSKILL
ncbi:spidroin 2A variant 1 [Trichonephila inaurata madagascariensis]|uniref:Spidroin 2A variant 1 n=1 Tax=Trichonephila inaurata madagascariensis TaxID=2747483 RepID=A0A8X6IZ92_9ARAC|nr:spidroin 2A variant 1 [Trichonephila inaurata madagascariensis]